MAEEKKGFFRRLAEGLTKTRNNIVSGMDAIFNGFSDIDEDFYDEIEEILIMGDIGINATTSIIENLKKKVKEQHIRKPEECKELLINSIKEQMRVGETAYEFEHCTSVVGRKAEGSGTQGHSGGGGYVPGSGGRTAYRVGEPRRCGDHRRKRRR